MPLARSGDGTDDHPGPARPPAQRGREALIVAFPTPRALPVPVAGTPLGRDWLAAHGAPDTRVSTSHVAFSRDSAGLKVEDLGSRNGTFVDGVRLRPREQVRIDDGARIRVGRTLLVYRDGLIGGDAPMPPLGHLRGPFGLREVAWLVEALRQRPSTNILLEGETGSGKELLAEHIASMLRPQRPYVALNVAAVPAGVFEAQLFGYMPGAYSGSGAGSRGVILSHNHGAVFLDEIGDLPAELQPKLLRFLDYRHVFRVGATTHEEADVLVIAATLKSLEELAQQDRFRLDLVARFGVRIELPPLRDRVEDLFDVMQALAARRQPRESYDPEQVEVEAVERLAMHPWPKNVRELAAVLDRIAAFVRPPALPYWAVERVLGALPVESVKTLTSDTVQRVLAECGGNESAAARRLNISRGRLRRFLQKA